MQRQRCSSEQDGFVLLEQPVAHQHLGLELALLLRPLPSRLDLRLRQRANPQPLHNLHLKCGDESEELIGTVGEFELKPLGFATNSQLQGCIWINILENILAADTEDIELSRIFLIVHQGVPFVGDLHPLVSVAFPEGLIGAGLSCQGRVLLDVKFGARLAFDSGDGNIAGADCYLAAGVVLKPKPSLIHQSMSTHIGNFKILLLSHCVVLVLLEMHGASKCQQKCHNCQCFSPHCFQYILKHFNPLQLKNSQKIDATQRSFPSLYRHCIFATAATKLILSHL